VAALDEEARQARKKQQHDSTDVGPSFVSFFDCYLFIVETMDNI